MIVHWGGAAGEGVGPAEGGRRHETEKFDSNNRDCGSDRLAIHNERLLMFSNTHDLESRGK
jgi:hypothetical protein